MRVCAVLVNWRQPDLTSAAVTSLEAQVGLSELELSIVVVDNGSDDGSVEILRARHPRHRVLPLTGNHGFGAGVNAAIRETDADVYVLLNNDAVAEERFVAELCGALAAHPEAAAVTARILLRDPVDGIERINSTGNELTRSGNGRDRDWLVPVSRDRRAAGEVAGFSGGASAIRASALADAGLFDESLFMYYEDTDLSWRLRRRGWTIRYQPSAVAVHAHAASSGTGSEVFRFWNQRNRVVIALRHTPGDVALRALSRTALRAGRSLCGGSSSRAEGRQTLRALASAARALPATLRERRRADRAATVARSEVATFLVPDGDVPAEAGVLLDATSLPPSWGGVARYIVGLLTGLAELGVTVDVAVKQGDLERLRSSAPEHRYHVAPRSVQRRPVRFVWEQVGLPRLASKLGVRVLHSPHYSFPLVMRQRSVVTVHDATFFTDPAAHSRLKGVFFRWWTRRAGAAADALISPSRATADSVTSNVRMRKGRVLVAHLGVDTERFHPPSSDECAAFARAHGLGEGEPWIAFLGTIEPRKNVASLLRAHRRLRAEQSQGRAAGPERTVPPLLISGARGWDTDAIRLLDEARPDDGVHELGYLPLDDLHVLLGGASVVVYPSIGEGFGLPVLEAMACGAAVLTTRRLSIPEVGGDAVAYAEPDADALHDALEGLLADETERRRLSERAIDRAAGFTWRRSAEQHVIAYGTEVDR